MLVAVANVCSIAHGINRELGDYKNYAGLVIHHAQSHRFFLMCMA